MEILWRRTTIIGLIVVMMLAGTLDAQESTPDSDPEAELRAIPILPTLHLPTVREIYQRGQEAGHPANRLTKIGGSNLMSSAFLYPLDYGVYDLGPYEDNLRATVDFFAGSYGRASVAAQKGFNALLLLDVFFADPERCRIKETPLSCEIRRSQPSVAVVMFSPNDLQHVESDAFRESVEEITRQLAEAGVIPILYTFMQRPNSYFEKHLEFNLIVADVAAEYRVPLVNLWLAGQALPEMGVQADNVHYSYSGTLDFNGDEEIKGHTLWSLLTLQTLDKLRREIPMRLAEDSQE